MRILLADDQPAVRHALRVLLERQPGLEVVGEAADGLGLLTQSAATRPDLVLLDWQLPGVLPPELLLALRRISPHLPVIALSGRPEVKGAALQAGADAFVCKCDPPELLLSAIAGCRRLCPLPRATPHIV